MNSYDIAADTLTMGGTPIDTTYGIVNMYRDEDHAKDVDHIEKAFSRLESDAARIIQKLDKAVEKGQVTLPRNEVNTLRKFLFLLAYRNDHRSRQFIDEIFDEVTRNHIKEFQTEHGLKDTKAVWLFNIKNMLDSEHWEIGDNPKILWADRTDYKLEQQIYQLGFFCAPQGFEFINTGSMGLFVGSPIINPVLRARMDAMFPAPEWRPEVQGLQAQERLQAQTGVIILTRSWPLTPRLVVMLRHRAITEEQDLLAQGLRPNTFDFLPSYYRDFPRKRAIVTYIPPLSAATQRMMAGSRTEEDMKLLREFGEENKLDGQSVNARLRDTLKFEISTLNEDQAARVNVLSLTHCAEMVNFMDTSSLRKSLKRYANDRTNLTTIVMDVTRFESLDSKLEAAEKQALGT